MEHRHRDALQRIYQAEQIWSEQGNPERSFLLLHTGGMQSHIDHPGWEESWPVPSEDTIDDLAEMGMLRVDPSPQQGTHIRPHSRGTSVGRRAAVGRFGHYAAEHAGCAAGRIDASIGRSGEPDRAAQ